MTDYWKELQSPPPLAGAAPPGEVLVPSNAKLVQQMRTAAGWLLAYAVLTVVNLGFAYLKVPLRAPVSVITAEYVVAVGYVRGSWAIPVGYVLALLLVAGMAIGAALTYRFVRWVFWAAIGFIAVDAVVTYNVTNLGGVWPFVLHFVAIWFLVLGGKAARLYAVRRAAAKA